MHRPSAAWGGGEADKMLLRLRQQQNDTEGWRQNRRTVSGEGALFTEEIMQAMQVIAASRVRRAKTATDGGWEMETVPHAPESAVPSGVGVQNHPGLRGRHGQAFSRWHSSTPGTSRPATALDN